MFEDYCIIMPDRGDRAELTEFVISRLPKEIKFFHMNEAPQGRTFDLTKRIREGVSLAKSQGYKKAFIVENDDFYPPEYFQPFTEDFAGYQETIYYSLKNATFQSFVHPGRSSLFCTAFTLSALDQMRWPSDNTVFIDIELWHYAGLRRKTRLLRNNPPCIGMKHGIGLCGGKGHKQVFSNIDVGLQWLSDRVDKEAFKFYFRLASKL